MASLTQLKADRDALEALQGLHGRTPALAAALRSFNGPACIVKGHGRARRLSDSRCLACLIDAMTLRSTAAKAGKADALRRAHAQVAREAAALVKAAAKEEATAVKVQLKADKAAAVKAAERSATRSLRASTRAAAQRTERAQVAAPPERIAGASTGSCRASVDSDGQSPDDDSPPWE